MNAIEACNDLDRWPSILDRIDEWTIFGPYSSQFVSALFDR